MESRTRQYLKRQGMKSSDSRGPASHDSVPFTETIAPTGAATESYLIRGPHGQSKAKVSDGLSAKTLNGHGYWNAKETVFWIDAWDDHVQLVEARRNQPAESHLRKSIADAGAHQESRSEPQQQLLP